MKKKLIDEIVKKVTVQFRTFGGQDSQFNPITP
jgi:hypothetical protein